MTTLELGIPPLTSNEVRELRVTLGRERRLGEVVSRYRVGIEYI